MKLKIFSFLFVILQAQFATAEVQLAQAYQSAVRDASIAEPGEIARNLIAITKENSHLVWNEDQSKILVVTWKSQSSYEKFLRDETHTSTSEAFVVWVTTVPQVQQFCQEYIRNTANVTEEAVNLRLKQYLGLHYTWQYDVFVEMWVNPAEIFRPCVDPEVNDCQCDLEFGNPAPVVQNIRDYPLFYKNLYFQDFRSQPGVPWTGLGYTYDWKNSLTEQGASEFILIPGAAYEIKNAVTTMTYCKPE